MKIIILYKFYDLEILHNVIDTVVPFSEGHLFAKKSWPY